MSRDDWYRNEEWNAEIESAFRAKLSRSRSGRPQYLRIQANYLADRYPKVALGLIDEYFLTNDEFDVSSAHVVRATSYLALGMIDEAVASYKAGLIWEADHPRVISTARLNYPRLVVDQRITAEYDNALEILGSRFQAHDHAFPSTRYEWNGCCALIAEAQGNHVDAREFAERALRAATETKSPFRFHRTVGVVKDSSDEFGRRIKRIVRPSKLRSLYRLISSR